MTKATGTFFKRTDAINWSKIKVLASLVMLAGVLSVARVIWSIPEFFSDGTIPNPAFFSDLRLPPAEAVQNLRSAYVANFATVFLSAIPFLLMTVLLLAIIRDLYRIARLKALIAGLFLGASIISGLLAGLTVLRVSRFAFQSTILAADEQSWLEGGITYLNQLHLIFVDAWYFFAGIGWVFMGLAAMGCRNWGHVIGYVALISGVMVVSGVVGGFWLPNYGEITPSMVGKSAFKLVEAGLSLGFVTAGLLVWSLSSETSEKQTEVV